MIGGRAWIFPGQGSQSVGMGKDLAESHPEARDVYDTADAILGFSVSALCWEGPAEDLTRTSNQQPALFTTCIAMQRAFQADGKLPEPDYVAGHSLGEYSALVAAGALDFEDALRLVRRRGALMERHGIGGMIAIIGLDEEAARVLANETGTELANINCPGQVTLSGDDDALAVAELAAGQRGARRVVRLPVNGAFHSSLMRPVAAGLAPDIERTEFREPVAPLVTNVLAEPVSHPDDLRQELIDQIYSVVNWTGVFEFLARSGVSECTEIGPGNVLAGLGRRIDRSVTVVTAEQLLGSNGGEG